MNMNNLHGTLGGDKPCSDVAYFVTEKIHIYVHGSKVDTEIMSYLDNKSHLSCH